MNASHPTMMEAWLWRVLIVAAGGCTLLFAFANTHLSVWLDEACRVYKASLPIPELIQYLRHDDHTPLYYLLLSGWEDFSKS